MVGSLFLFGENHEFPAILHKIVGKNLCKSS